MPGRQRLRFRSPGIKPGQRIGPLGPFRGRLGLQWVVAPLVLAAVLLVAGWYFLEGGRPGDPWRPVTAADRISPGSARAVGGGIFVARLPDGSPVAVRAQPGCALRIVRDGYEDCQGRSFGPDGVPASVGTPLDLVPVRIHRGDVYIDPSRRLERGPDPG